jgi:hypothetical protein
MSINNAKGIAARTDNRMAVNNRKKSVIRPFLRPSPSSLHQCFERSARGWAIISTLIALMVYSTGNVTECHPG